MIKKTPYLDSLHFRVDDISRDIISALEKELACSQGEVCRRALRIFDLLLKAQNNGNEIILKMQTGKEKQILIG